MQEGTSLTSLLFLLLLLLLSSLSSSTSSSSSSSSSSYSTPLKSNANLLLGMSVDSAAAEAGRSGIKDLDLVSKTNIWYQNRDGGQILGKGENSLAVFLVRPSSSPALLLQPESPGGTWTHWTDHLR